MDKPMILALLLAVAAIVFFAISTWFIYSERYIQSLLSLAIGLILLSSALSILREYRYRSSR